MPPPPPETEVPPIKTTVFSRRCSKRRRRTEAQLQTDTEVLDRPLLDYENDQHLLDSDDV